MVAPDSSEWNIIPPPLPDSRSVQPVGKIDWFVS
jgi:hypothetical protein